MRAHIFGLSCIAALCVACGRAAPRVEPYAVRAIVAPAIAALEARVQALAAPPADATIAQRTESVLAALMDPSPRMRKAALEDAKGLGDAGVPDCARILGSEQEDDQRRLAAATALGAIATTASTAALCTGLETAKIPWLRAQCAYQMSLSLDARVLPRLLLRMKYEVDGETVVWIVDALARRGNLAGAEALRVVARDTRNPVASAAALERGAALAAELGANDLDHLAEEWRTGALERRHPTGAPEPALELEGWRNILKLATFDLRQVDDARFVLVQLDAWIVPMLVQALHDEDVYTRVHACQCLERRGVRGAAAYDALVDALRDVRIAPNAALALGAIGDARAAPLLERTLGETRDLDLRLAATRALGTLAKPSSLVPVARAFDAKEPLDLRQAAAEALLALDGRVDAATFLLDALTRKDADAGEAESALGAWISTRARATADCAPVETAWKAMDPAPFEIPTRDQVAARQRARAELVRTHAHALGLP